ncbi:MAG: TIGR04282 family arsenosugar biosynthesis glycosyltransferase [Nitrospirota bacterium]
MNTEALVIMAKAPRAESVKTRLRGHLADGERLALYESLLEGTIQRLQDIPGVDTFIAYTPAGDREYFAAWGLPLFPQSEGDLGLRMHEALGAVLKRDYRKAALVGVDIPALTAGVVREAMGLLESHDLVFGPARDGGYYLVGMTAPRRAVFEAIPWSSPKTLEGSVRKARSLGLSVAFTRELSDIDTIEDLKRPGQARPGAP